MTTDYGEAVNKCLASRLNRQLSASDRLFVAEELEANGYENAFSPDQAVDRLEGLLRTRTIRSTRQKADSSEAGQHSFPWLWPLSIAYAAIADDDPLVVGVRDRLLEGHLIKMEDVLEWIANRRTPLAKPPRRGPVKLPVLSYAVPEDEWVRRMIVTPGSDLDALRDLADYLADKTGWNPATAATWILTGAPPPIPAVRVTAANRFGSRYGNRPRMTLTVDLGVSPKELASIYAEHRRSFVGRQRSVAPRTLDIVENAMMAPPDATWQYRLREWNRSHPDDQMGDIRTFRRIVNRGLKHLLNTRVRLQNERNRSDGLR